MLKSFILCVCVATFVLTGCIPSADEATATAKPAPVKNKKNVMGNGNNPRPNPADYK